VYLARILLIVAALAVAAVTAFLVRNYLQGKEAEIAQNGKQEEKEQLPSVKVLVAVRDLPAGSIATTDMFRWQNWPEEGLAEEFIVEGRDGEVKKPEDLVGWAVRRAISIGEPIVTKRLIKPGEAGFLAGVLAPGMRAATINVTAETGTAGFILPGDRVDVVLTQEVRQGEEDAGGRNKIVSETVLSDVRVLAIDQTFDDVEEQTRVGKTVTVELTLKEAEGLAVAKRMGRLSLVLRSLSRNAEVEQPSAFTSDEEVSRFLRVRSSAVPRVLVARHGLPAGTLLRDTDYTWFQLETGANFEGMIVEAYVSEVALRGSYLKSAVDARGPIMQTNIIRPGQQGFIVAALAPGMRAVSVSVTQVSGVSGFVSPGDRIDLLLTHEVVDSSEKPVLTPRRFAETILRDLRLLAIEQTVDATTGKPVIGQTVTIEVTPVQAEVVALASSMGEISLTLRSVPSADNGQDAADKEQVTDISISEALLDQLILGTARDPNFIRRRSELANEEDTPIGDAAAALGGRSVTVYRSTAPSTVIIER
jgi:pilus assembly protein CpaB